MSHENDTLFLSLADHMLDGVILVGWEGTVIFANRAAAQLMELDSPADGIGLSMLGFIHPDSRKAVMEDLNLIREGKRGFEADYRFYKLVTRQGTEKWIEAIGTQVAFRGQTADLVTMRDITARKTAHEALQNKKKLYRSLMDQAPIGLCTIDTAGNILYVNLRIKKITGYSRKELLGRNIFQLDMVDPKARADFSDRLNNRLQGGGAFPIEARFVRRDNRIVWLDITARAVSEGDRIIGFQIVVRDITKRKKAEEEKAKLEAQLQRARKMEALGTLAGGVAHDLNNVLGGLVSYPELLLMQLSEDSPLRGPMTTIQQSGMKASAIVNDLLTLTRRGVAHPEVLNLNDLIVAQCHTPEHEKLLHFHQNVTVELHLDEHLLNLSGSPVHLSKTVMNLISNAAEAMEDGGTIIVSTANRYIDTPLSGYDSVREGDYVILSIADTGIGISPEDMDRIFEPFYTKKVMGRSGTGLGMAVVWGTVKDHDGYIDIKSTAGRGTSITLYFPATRRKIKRKSLPGPREEYLGHGERVLIVDDVAEQRLVGSTMLQELGYRVNTVASGEEALEYLKEHTADLVVLDMIMDPGIDGLETYKRMLDINRHQKAIITSGYSESQRVKEAQDLGVGTYIKKPYLMEQLGRAVRTELDTDLNVTAPGP